MNDTSSPRIVRVMFSILGFLLADYFIVQVDAVKRYYLGGVLRGKQYSQVYGIVDPKFFQKKPGTMSRRLKLITVGTITPTKNYDLLLDVATESKKRKLAVDFSIAGRVNPSHQNYYNGLAGRIANEQLAHVEFLGECKEIDRVLDAHCVYFCCSKRESSPTAVWEGMAKGLPVISTDVGNVSEVVRDGTEGFICEPKAASVVDCIEKFISDEDLREHMGAQAKIRTHELFGLRENGEILKSIYNQLV